MVTPFKKVVVGVSGGADSMALAHIMIKLGYDVTIAHLNHGLRGKESDGDEKFVKMMAKKWDVSAITLKIRIPKKGNLENNARLLRYDFLEKTRNQEKAEYIAVAHHLDDQIESIIMHMLRGAGARGMQGMYFAKGKIIRPLLSVTKNEILSYLKENKIKFRTDKTNFDIKYKRNNLRHVLIPALKKRFPSLEKKLLQLSEISKKKIAVTEKQAKIWIKKYVTDKTFEIKDFLKSSDDVQSEILFILAGYEDVYSADIIRLKEFIKRGITGKLTNIGNTFFRTAYGKVTISDKSVKSEKLTKVKLTGGGIMWGNWKIKYSGDADVYVRQWKKGDRFEPCGMRGSKKLQDFFTDKKIPAHERNTIPIIVDPNDKILSISDIRIAKGGEFLKKCLQINKI